MYLGRPGLLPLSIFYWLRIIKVYFNYTNFAKILHVVKKKVQQFLM